MVRRTGGQQVRGVLALAACVALAGAPAVLAAPAGAAEHRSTFVVVLDDGETEPGAVGRAMAQRHGGSLGFVYEHALKGFSITVPDRAAAAIASARGVTSIERDQVFRTAAEVPSGVARTFAPGNAALSIDGADDERVDVDIAIIDSGIDSTHPDLHVVQSTDCTGGSPLRGSCKNGSAPDGNGHGTHVAGSAAALDDGRGVVGMATGARLHAVKVLSDSGSGYTSWIIAGIDWVTARADTIEVANMSLGCECSSTAQDQAIANSVARGVTYAVAAGNSDKDAATFSPANHPDVITVSALADFDGLAGGSADGTYCRVDQDDTLADFSNFGGDVEIAAPGVCITSTWPGGGYSTISGTSMASPHVAGAAALLASTRATDSKADTEAIAKLLVDNGNVEWTDDSGDGVREQLLDVRAPEFAPKMLTQSGGGGVEPAPSELTLTALGTKIKGTNSVELRWSGAGSTSVDVFRDGARIITTENDGEHVDGLGTKGGGSYTYRVCEAGSPTCSPEVTVTF